MAKKSQALHQINSLSMEEFSKAQNFVLVDKANEIIELTNGIFKSKTLQFKKQKFNKMNCIAKGMIQFPNRQIIDVCIETIIFLLLSGGIIFFLDLMPHDMMMYLLMIVSFYISAKGIMNQRIMNQAYGEQVCAWLSRECDDFAYICELLPSRHGIMIPRKIVFSIFAVRKQNVAKTRCLLPVPPRSNILPPSRKSKFLSPEKFIIAQQFMFNSALNLYELTDPGIFGWNDALDKKNRTITYINWEPRSYNNKNVIAEHRIHLNRIPLVNIELYIGFLILFMIGEYIFLQRIPFLPILLLIVMGIIGKIDQSMENKLYTERICAWLSRENNMFDYVCGPMNLKDCVLTFHNVTLPIIIREKKPHRERIPILRTTIKYPLTKGEFWAAQKEIFMNQNKITHSLDKMIMNEGKIRVFSAAFKKTAYNKKNFVAAYQIRFCGKQTLAIRDTSLLEQFIFLLPCLNHIAADDISIGLLFLLLIGQLIILRLFGTKSYIDELFSWLINEIERQGGKMFLFRRAGWSLIDIMKFLFNKPIAVYIIAERTNGKNGMIE